MKKIITPLEDKQVRKLKAGDKVLLSGFIYTARDQAHQRLVSALSQGRSLPLDIKGQVIYYCGPTRAPRGRVIGSCGPTTSSRMDEFSPTLLKAGLRAMIGKGRRSLKVRSAMKAYAAVYFLTYAGCGALLAGFIKSATLVAYADLGPEAMFRLYAQDFPLIVGIDSRGRSVFQGDRDVRGKGFIC